MTEALQGEELQKKLLIEIKKLKQCDNPECWRCKYFLDGITEAVKADDFRFKAQDLSQEEYEIRQQIRKELGIKYD